MKKTFVSGIALTCLVSMACLVSVSVQAQTMPAPNRMPRTPVSSQLMVEQRDPIPASRQVQGPAAIIDGEKLHIGDSDIRLFGVVPPQLAASFGPQARSALDVLANGQSVTCQIRDRDRDGRLLATCHNAAGSDMALELLKHGLAVTARGSIAATELSAPYLAAEQAAQNQKIGIWSVSIPAAAAIPAIVTPVAPKVESVTAPTEAETKKEEKVAPRSDKVAVAEQTSEAQAKITADIINQHTQSQIDDSAGAANDDTGFFERYQILIACFLMLVTALSVIGALWAQKRRDRLDEIKAIAAALRGELMAARGVCYGRAKSITNDDEDRAAIWPRVRATLYQAYVSRLGLLGAELARQIASIYGQSSDYAAFYGPSATVTDSPKKQALETLLKNIDEVLPKLASIEQSGAIPSVSATSYAPRSRYDVSPPAALKPSTQVTAISPPRALIEKKTEKTEPAETAEKAVVEEPKPVVKPESTVKPAAATAAPVEPTAYTPYVQTTPTAAEIAARTPVLLWEAVRGFIQNHRNAITEQPDPHSGDYAAIIEADMARYQYGDNIEALDISPKKKQG